jgi:hypothetical protein
MENPRLMIALIAVMDAQTMNGRVIQPSGGVVFEKSSYTAPVETIVTAKSEWRHDTSCYCLRNKSERRDVGITRRIMSAFGSEAEISNRVRNVCFVPEADELAESLLNMCYLGATRH